MLYSEIEQFFEDEATVNDLLTQYEPIFIDIDEIDDTLKDNQVNTMEEVDALIGKLSGLANKCEMVAELAETNKKSLEGKITFKKIQECEKDKKKPNMSQIKEEVSNEVQFIRRVRNIFKAYTQRADRALGGCQSRLKKKEKIRVDGEV
jgi:hypothetical protein